MEWLSESAAFPLMFVPFATSIVLVMGIPEAEQAQPRALVGGHLVATLVGLIIVKIAGPSPWAAALSPAGEQEQASNYAHRSRCARRNYRGLRQ